MSFAQEQKQAGSYEQPARAENCTALDGETDRVGPLQIGFGRPVPADYRGDLAARLEWFSGSETDAEDGPLNAALTVTSPEAAALRIGLRAKLAAGAAVRFTSLSDPEQQFRSLFLFDRGRDGVSGVFVASVLTLTYLFIGTWLGALLRSPTSRDDPSLTAALRHFVRQSRQPSGTESDGRKDFAAAMQTLESLRLRLAGRRDDE